MQFICNICLIAWIRINPVAFSINCFSCVRISFTMHSFFLTCPHICSQFINAHNFSFSLCSAFAQNALTLCLECAQCSSGKVVGLSGAPKSLVHCDSFLSIQCNNTELQISVWFKIYQTCLNKNGCAADDQKCRGISMQIYLVHRFSYCNSCWLNICWIKNFVRNTFIIIKWIIFTSWLFNIRAYK